ncbi:MAG: PEP/pyruvate-binding domain-containing protein [Patescibacteria group bacterium]
MSMNYCVWLADYTETDIEPFAKFLDHEMPIPYGFVIPSNILTSIYLDPEIQHQLIPIFESTNINIEEEREHVRKLVERIIRNSKTPRGFFTSIQTAYEKLLEKEREYLKKETHDLHKALHLMKHVYAPPAVRISFLPNSPFDSLATGEISLEHTIVEQIVKYVDLHIGNATPGKIPSMLVQRALYPQIVGSCETTNMKSNNNDQIVIHSYFGAKELEDAADVYIVQKEGAQIIAKHSVEQPFKYILKGTEYKKVNIHPQDASREVMTDSQIQAVTFLAKDFEKQVYFPQKISFAFENGQLFVTKLRAL